MSRTPFNFPPSGGTWKRNAGVLVAALGLVAVTMTGAGLTSASASAGEATEVAFATAVQTDGTPIPTTPGTPKVFVARNVAFAVTFRLTGDDGVTDLPISATSSSRSVGFEVYVVAGATKLAASYTTSVPVTQVTSATSVVTIPGVKLTTAANNVQLGVRPTSNGIKIRSGSTPVFEVVKDFTYAGSTTQLLSTDDPPNPPASTPCVPTSSKTVCADLILPSGTDQSVLLSTGACDGVGTASNCPTDKLVVQALVSLPSTRYSGTNPATLIIKCDKSACPGGGISSYHVYASLDPTASLRQAPACTSKGVVDTLFMQAAFPYRGYCVDYVQSKRDGSGDTWLYFLFTEDAKGTSW